MSKSVVVHKLNHEGHETWRYEGFILENEGGRIKIKAHFDREDVEFHGVSLRRGDIFIETFYTDRWYNSTIRIENEEWIIWMLHPRSYFLEEGTVTRGEPVGVMGAIGIATGPHVHYSIYNKENETFVDPRRFLP